jgi:hypothetical protein
MKCALVGSRYFGASVFEALRKQEGSSSRASSPQRTTTGCTRGARCGHRAAHIGEPEDRAGRGHCRRYRPGHRRHAHTQRRVSNEALARSKLGGSRLPPFAAAAAPRIAAVEWTILEGDPIAGGSSITSPTAGTRGRSRRRTGASSRKANGARALGTRARADGSWRCCARWCSTRRAARRAAGQRAGPALCHQGPAHPQGHRADR